ncbi:MAG: signal recognition particle protein [Xanthomonadales bacterium]|nr:signal recognition particle protein [Xanthomonadales bacterium]MCB1633023.1 signal recognition particle protein [Xanthomonadales bacterium]
MFQNLTQRLSSAIERMRGRARLSEEHVREGLREVRIALLEADVALPVVQTFIGKVRDRALGREVMESLSPAQTLVKIVHEELVRLMGEQNESLQLAQSAPVVILLAGLQGAGKTTTAAKLARFLAERAKKRVAVVSCDVYRPAAIAQLETLAGQVGAQFIASSGDEAPAAIATRALEQARKQLADVLIVDTAGRLHVDEAMMAEVAGLHAQLQPAETLFVVDSMTGQDAANSAKAFAEALPLTGVILTKTDGDARGGAALSVREITGKPIKFLGAGEKTDALEPFHPDRVASRILGMGDVLSLIEDVTRKVDQDKMQKLANKVVAGKGFDFNDFREHLKQMQSMGGLTGLLDKLPGMAKIPQEMKDRVNDGHVVRMVAIIDSMTPKERRFPATINGSRRARIARGSGTKPADVNQLMKQFQQMEKMMKKLKGGGIKGMLKGLQRRMPGMGGGLPPGGMPRF